MSLDLKNEDANLNKHIADNIKQFENKMDKQIIDDSTTKKYELGINNGLIYYKEVTS